MPVVCPAVLEASVEDYRTYMEKVSGFAHRVQIDLTDGKFADSPTIKPEQAWWSVGIRADFHLMYKDPLPAVKTVLKHRPHLVIVHAEADGDFEAVANLCKQHGIKVGICLLKQTSPEVILPVLNHIDHVLLFVGTLGKYGGQADLSQLSKVEFLKRHRPDIEIGWDGGVNDQNAAQLVFGGVDVLNAGGFIKNTPDPARAYRALTRIADETGTT